MKVFFTSHQSCLHTSIWTIFHVTQVLRQNSLCADNWGNFHENHCQSNYRMFGRLLNTSTNNSKQSYSPKQKLLRTLVILLGAQKPKIRISLRRANTEQLHSLNHNAKRIKFQIVQAHGQIHGQDVHKQILKGTGRMSSLASHNQKWWMPRDYKGNGLPFRPKTPVTAGSKGCRFTEIWKIFFRMQFLKYFNVRPSTIMPFINQKPSDFSFFMKILFF